MAVFVKAIWREDLAQQTGVSHQGLMQRVGNPRYRRARQAGEYIRPSRANAA